MSPGCACIHFLLDGQQRISRNRKRQLPLQEQLGKSRQTRKGEISELHERLTPKPSSSRVSSQWKSRVSSQRKSTLIGPTDLHRHQGIVFLGPALNLENFVDEAHQVPVDGSSEGDCRDAAAASLSASAANCDLVSINLWTPHQWKNYRAKPLYSTNKHQLCVPRGEIEGERTSTTAGSATASRCRKVSRNCDSTPVDGTERLRAAAQYPSAIMSIGDNDLDSRLSKARASASLMPPSVMKD